MKVICYTVLTDLYINTNCFFQSYFINCLKSYLLTCEHLFNLSTKFCCIFENIDGVINAYLITNCNKSSNINS